MFDRCMDAPAAASTRPKSQRSAGFVSPARRAASQPPATSSRPAAAAANHSGGKKKTASRPAAASTTAVAMRCSSTLLDSGQAAEAPFAGGKVLERRAKMAGIEVRPQHIGKVQLGVGQLPQKKIGQPLFAAGANEQIRRRDRKSTRQNSSHVAISYDLFCMK